MSKAQDIENIKSSPTAFVIFGATGDLSRRKIFPSLYQLFQNDFLPKKFKIFAVARTPLVTEKFVSTLPTHINVINAKKWKEFTNFIEYIPADVAENINLDILSKKLDEFEKVQEECVQRILYMAIAHDIYKSAFENLGKASLNLGCKKHNLKARIVVEKPFGADYKSAQVLNASLSKDFSEDQIYRIDHFLGKETVQNIFTFRFGNEIFEPIWNNKYIDHVQITAAERLGIERRGNFYDKTGALRDFVQNHLLQLLSIVTMEEPKRFDQAGIREKKLEILESLKKMSEDEVAKNTIRGQYEGYRQEENVDKDSQAETFAMIKLFIENQRWSGVPFYLRTGKKMTGKVTSIIFSLKEGNHDLFKNFWNGPMPNHITIQIDPTEGIGIRLAAKKPGIEQKVQPVDMEFCYNTSFSDAAPSAYERLLLDIMSGDQTLFLGPVGPSWKFIDPIRDAWDKNKSPLFTYKPGTWGPSQADKLIEADGRQWLAPLLTICKI